MVKGRKVILERASDYELIKGIDGKLDTVITTLAVTCEQVGKHEKTINGNGVKGILSRLSALERWMYLVTGGGIVIIGILKLWH